MKKPKQKRRGNTPLLCVALGLSFALGGCATNDMSDLEQYAQKVLSRPARSTIEPLPEVKIPETYVYKAADAHKPDPFESFLATAAAKPKGPGKAVDKKTAELQREIGTHNLQELEHFDLDSLRMVGTLQDKDELWAIILDKTGTVHRVTVGDYMGRNYGKIMGISEDKIELREIVSANGGGLEERPASIALSEPQK